MPRTDPGWYDGSKRDHGSLNNQPEQEMTPADVLKEHIKEQKGMIPHPIPASQRGTNPPRKKKEEKKLNSDVEVVNPSKPIKFKDFSMLSFDLQKHYLEVIIQRYPAISISTIAEMMGCDSSSIATRIKDFNIQYKKIRGHSAERVEQTARFWKMMGIEKSQYSTGGKPKKSCATDPASENDNGNESEVIFNIKDAIFTADVNNVSEILKKLGFTGKVEIRVSTNE